MSYQTRRCTSLIRIGDLPGMNQVVAVCGHSALGRSPEAAHTATLVTPRGGRGVRSLMLAVSAALRASKMRKKRGAAAWIPTKAGLLVLSKLPTQTTST